MTETDRRLGFTLQQKQHVAKRFGKPEAMTEVSAESTDRQILAADSSEIPLNLEDTHTHTFINHTHTFIITHTLINHTHTHINNHINSLTRTH